MPGPRLPMRKIRDVLRLSAAGMSKRKIAASLGVSATAARDCIGRAQRAGLTWPLPEGLTDEALELRLYPPPIGSAKDSRPQPDWAAMHRELRRPGVTLQLLWEEYRAIHPAGYGYSRFCERYRTWEARLCPSMRQNHVAGERMFVDYAGTTLELIDASTGEARTAQLFVAVLELHLCRGHLTHGPVAPRCSTTLPWPAWPPLHRTHPRSTEQLIHIRADSDEVARAFRDDTARHSDMMSPGSGALAGG